jgi:hypothetical protein
MLNLEPVFEFSRNNCIAICAFLVPANLLITVQILISLAIERPDGRGGAGTGLTRGRGELAPQPLTSVPHSKPPWQIRLAVALAITFALTLFLHVFTWFSIGVVTPVTFILFGLGTTCLAINIWASIYWQKFPQLVRSLFAGAAASLRIENFFRKFILRVK